ncbi:SDR family NAD(P)-dependent oxidoreductase [Streptomyces violaceusniger]|uniref:SDR family NAD(P)-dependent oxidoreductase n=1 Tax=Streptomyces violaceusniger TaxID=68280 RepID=UPI0031CF9E94
MTVGNRRVALVTGAARGLGVCIARRLHDQGYRVALTDLDEEGAVKAAADRLGRVRGGVPRHRGRLQRTGDGPAARGLRATVRCGRPRSPRDGW